MRAQVRSPDQTQTRSKHGGLSQHLRDVSDVEAGGSQVQGQPLLQSSFRTSVCYISGKAGEGLRPALLHSFLCSTLSIHLGKGWRFPKAHILRVGEHQARLWGDCSKRAEPCCTGLDQLRLSAFQSLLKRWKRISRQTHRWPIYPEFLYTC